MQVLPSIVSIPRGARVRRFAAGRALPLKKSLAAAWMAVCTGFAALAFPLHADAQSEASVALALVPVASVVGAVSATGAAAGEVLAFVPNAIGRGLLHNEKLT